MNSAPYLHIQRGPPKRKTSLKIFVIYQFSFCDQPTRRLPRIIRNESNASRSRGFPAVVPWVGDTSSVSSGDVMLSRREVGFLRGITKKAEGVA